MYIIKSVSFVYLKLTPINYTTVTGRCILQKMVAYYPMTAGPYLRRKYKQDRKLESRSDKF